MPIDISTADVASPDVARPRRRRVRSLITAVALSAAAVLIGLSGAGVTYAFLTATAIQPGATITAGTAAIQIDGSAAATLGNRTLSPNTPAAWAFTVANTGSVKMDISAAIAATTSPAYSAATRALLVPVASTAACTATVGGTPAPLAGFTATTSTMGVIAAGGSQVYCLVLSLPVGTSGTGAGSPLSFTVTVNAAQSAS